MGFRVAWDERAGIVVPPVLRGDEAPALDAVVAKGNTTGSVDHDCTRTAFGIVLVQAGRVVLTQGNDTRVVADAGAVVAVPAGVAVRAQAAGEPARWTCLAIGDRRRDAVLELHLLATAFVAPALAAPLVFAADGPVAQAARSAIAALESATPEAEDRIGDLVVALALEARSIDAELARCPGRSAEGRRRLHQRLVEAKRVAHRHHGNVSIAALAGAAGLSPWYFVRTFHAVFGETPYQYALDRRMAYARHLLLETGSSVRAIAQAVGFGNSSAFVRAFGQRFGLAPTRIRRRDREAAEAQARKPDSTSPHRGLREGAEAEARALARGNDELTTRTFG